MASKHAQTYQPDADPDEFADTAEECEGEAGDVGVTEGLQEEQIAAFLRPEASRDKERPAFDKDRERPDGN